MKLSADVCRARAATASARREAAERAGDHVFADRLAGVARAWLRAADEATLRALPTAPRALACGGSQ